MPSKTIRRRSATPRSRVITEDERANNYAKYVYPDVGSVKLKPVLPARIGKPGPIQDTTEGNGLLLFYGSVLSNWHPVRFYSRFDRLWFESSEHYYMWRKATHFNDARSAAQIMRMGFYPAVVKRMGKQVTGFDEIEWARVKGSIMACACTMKFGQHPDLTMHLLQTRPLHLVEASPTDLIWGIGLAENDPRALDKAQWRGENLLGEILMIVRTLILAHQGSEKTIEYYNLIHNVNGDEHAR